MDKGKADAGEGSSDGRIGASILRSGTSDHDDMEKFIRGKKIEAQDFGGQWYPAKVVDIDSNESEILVHFENWNNKFDEWIPMDSSRLRLLEKPVDPKGDHTFVKGEPVMASWTSYHKYPGTIQTVLSNDRYEVLFFDGFIKRLKSHKIFKPEKGELLNEAYSFTTGIGTKEERREKKRKLNIQELFSINKKKPKRKEVREETETEKSVKSYSGNKSKTKAGRVQSVLPVVQPASPATLETVTSGTFVATAATMPKKRKIVTDQNPVDLEVKYLDGRIETWTKQVCKRGEGRTAGKLDIVIMNPSGKKFRSRGDIVKYCEENGIIYTPDSFDFSSRGRPKYKTIQATPPVKAVEPAKITEETPAKKPRIEVAPPTPVQAATPLSAPLVEPVPAVPAPVEDRRIFIGDVEVQEENGQLKCPGNNCNKHFRRENLLHMHMKHYHPEFCKYLDHTPSVTDLAYARTVGSLEPVDVPPPGAGRKSDLVKQSTPRIDTTALSADKTVKKTSVAAAIAAEAPVTREPKKAGTKMSDIKMEVKPVTKTPETSALMEDDTSTMVHPLEQHQTTSVEESKNRIKFEYELEDVEVHLPGTKLRTAVGLKQVKTKRPPQHTPQAGPSDTSRKRVKQQCEKDLAIRPSKAWSTGPGAAPSALPAVPAVSVDAPTPRQGSMNTASQGSRPAQPSRLIPASEHSGKRHYSTLRNYLLSKMQPRYLQPPHDKEGLVEDLREEIFSIVKDLILRFYLKRSVTETIESMFLKPFQYIKAEVSELQDWCRNQEMDLLEPKIEAVECAYEEIVAPEASSCGDADTSQVAHSVAAPTGDVYGISGVEDPDLQIVADALILQAPASVLKEVSKNTHMTRLRQCYVVLDDVLRVKKETLEDRPNLPAPGQCLRECHVLLSNYWNEREKAKKKNGKSRKKKKVLNKKIHQPKDVLVCDAADPADTAAAESRMQSEVTPDARVCVGNAVSAVESRQKIKTTRSARLRAGVAECDELDLDKMTSLLAKKYANQLCFKAKKRVSGAAPHASKRGNRVLPKKRNWKSKPPIAESHVEVELMPEENQSLDSQEIDVELIGEEEVDVEIIDVEDEGSAKNEFTERQLGIIELPDKVLKKKNIKKPKLGDVRHDEHEKRGTKTTGDVSNIEGNPKKTLLEMYEEIAKKRERKALAKKHRRRPTQVETTAKAWVPRTADTTDEPAAVPKLKLISTTAKACVPRTADTTDEPAAVPKLKLVRLAPRSHPLVMGGRHKNKKSDSKRRKSSGRSRPPQSKVLLPGPQTDKKSVPTWLHIKGDGTEGAEDSKSPLTVSSEKLDETHKVEKLRRHEIINCTCGLAEEDGLMIQCDVCLCWQHGHCLSILEDTDVPDKYVCSVCKDPAKGRASMKYLHDQEWLREGVLPRLSFGARKDNHERTKVLKRSNDLSNSLTLLGQLIHSLRVKLNIAQHKDHPKLWLWNKWTDKPRLSGAHLKKETSEAGSSESHLHSTGCSERLLPKIPEPEKPIDPVECRLNLIEHLINYQAMVDAKLSSIESQVAELESMQEDAMEDEPVDKCPRTKATLTMLLRDLGAMKRIGTIS